VPSFGIPASAGFDMTESAEVSFSLSMTDCESADSVPRADDVDACLVRWVGEPQSEFVRASISRQRSEKWSRRTGSNLGSDVSELSEKGRAFTRYLCMCGLRGIDGNGGMFFECRAKGSQ
jgi:hypothetical protein